MDTFSLIQEPSTGTPHEQSSLLILRSNVSQTEALRLLGDSRLSNLALRMRRGSLQRIASVFVPFALYRVSYVNGRTRRQRFVAIDQIDGTLDLFEFPGAIAPSELTRSTSRNFLTSALNKEDAHSILLEKVMRTIFLQGFFQLPKPELQIDLKIMDFCIPYWLGFYGKDGALHCRVLDAVRNRLEGDKATKFFENWLTATNSRCN
jgi:hypothetical protein